MPRQRSDELSEVAEAISILDDVEKDWPRGVKNKLIKEALDMKKIDFYKKHFLLMTQKKGRKLAKNKKLASQADIARP